MTGYKQIFASLIIGLLVAACGNEANDLAGKKEQLETYKSELAELKARIEGLEKEIGAENTKKTMAEVLVAPLEVNPMPFRHLIEVRGSVQSRRNVQISAETMGRIEKIIVSEGSEVRAGQVMIELDADILRNNIAEVETQLELARAVFDRQANLWEQNIGTEIQYLQSKNNKEALERRLVTLRSQLKLSQIRAPFTGTIDDISVRVGEMAQPGMPLIRLVNSHEMYILADVSEAFLGKFEAGDKVEAFFPVQDKIFPSEISSVSRVINSQNRTFTVEVDLPTLESFDFRPNQVTVLRLVDYQREDAIVVPTRLIQTDEAGKYVFVIREQDGRKTARKARVSVGMSYNSQTEILAGLANGDQVIEKGYREVNEGVEIKLAAL
ncbi:MAG: efflux RND transporter periplasmic adaptor subunit [Cyclobacteriaceae bacterium]|nr:efflux RND transporter periplasmic adaptor subunit [Cyclobacteriaceae bacterium]